jgi:hypothetical protein
VGTGTDDVTGDEMPVSVVLETNRGGVAVTICTCGVLVLTGMPDHINACPAYLDWLASQGVTS